MSLRPTTPSASRRSVHLPAARRARRRGGPPIAARAALVALVALVLGAPATPVVAAPAPTVAEPDPAPGIGTRTGTAPPRYRPPVDAPVIDPFRPPAHRFGPGNRGLTYGVAPLTPIRASADGEVVFAGPVAGTLHVTIRHRDGLRTSYSFLAATAVVPGAAVAAGAIVGWSSEVFQFGVRTPDGTYLDPELLWRATWQPRLVPGGDDGTSGPPEAQALGDLVIERAGPLAAWVVSGGASLTAFGADTIDAFDRRLALWMHYATELRPAVHLRRLAEGFDRWLRVRDDCTDASTAVPAPAGRRIVVEVGGIGSTSESAAIARIDTAALGYEDGDVIRFSYAGGRVPPRPGDGEPADPADPFAGLTTTTYDAIASQGDVEESGRRLAVLLDEVARAAPGVPIDVIAHSQGGVVSRLALAHAEGTGQLPGEVQRLVTLGSPHQGADLATAIEAIGTDPSAAAVLDRARTLLGVELDPALPAAGQLSEVSPVVEDLSDRLPPAGVRFTSIAARGDLVVPAGRTVAPGARSATVSITGVSAHDHLPESPEATREILLALADRPPTCRGLHDVMTDVAVADAIGLLEDAVGAGAFGAGMALPG